MNRFFHYFGLQPYYLFMKKSILRIVYLLFLILTAFSCKKEKSQPPPQYGSLEGTITNQFGQPVNNATVSISNNSVVTGPDGSYRFPQLGVTAYTVAASASGYLPQNQPAEITPNQVTRLDFKLVTGQAYLSLSDSVVHIAPAGGSQTINVSSNGSWTVQHKGSWLSTKSAGNGNGNIDLQCINNTGTDDRADTLTIICGTLRKNVQVIQAAQLALTAYEGLLGNEETKIPDSVFLHFSKPIKSVNIQSNYTLCQCDINSKIVDQGKGVLFSYACGVQGGGDYPFTITATDALGNSLTQNIQVNFYRAKLTVTGFMTDYILVNNETEVLIATFAPAKIIRYSIAKNAIINTYDLTGIIAPTKLSFNPYDGKIYFVGADPNITGRNDSHATQPDVYTLNLQSGAINKAFTVKPSSPNDAYPTNVPYEIVFTKTGKGMMLLRSNNNSGLSWKLIDGTNNNKLSDYTGTMQTKFTPTDIQLSYDQTKIIMNPGNLFSTYGLYDSNTGKVTNFYPSQTTGAIFIRASRRDDQIYAGEIYNQYIMDFNGNTTASSSLDNRSNGSADFSYRPGEDKFIYFLDNESFRLMDYSRSVTLVKNSAVAGLCSFTATLDGQLGLAYKQNIDISSSLFIFNIQDLVRNRSK